MFVVRATADRLLTCLLKIEPQKLYARPSTSLPDGDYKLASALLDLADRELVAMIGWAKQIPGGSTISWYRMSWGKQIPGWLAHSGID